LESRRILLVSYTHAFDVLFRFEITMNDFSLVHEIDGIDELSSVMAGRIYV